MVRRDTKTLLLEQGTQLFLERGYHDTGIQDVLVAAGVPKGSFYHYFRSKEDFGLHVVNRYGGATLEYLDGLLDDASRPPLERIRRFFEEAFAGFTKEHCRHGCLMGNLGQELADLNDTFRECIRFHLDAWAARIGVCLREASERGELPAHLDPESTGRLLIDGFQGAALRMKLERKPAPLERFMQHYFHDLVAVEESSP